MGYQLSCYGTVVDQAEVSPDSKPSMKISDGSTVMVTVATFESPRPSLAR